MLTLGYREPSLVLLLGTQRAMAASGTDAEAFLNQPGCRVALDQRRFADDFKAALASQTVKPRLVTTINGFNLNGGRRLEIAVFANSPN